MQWLDGYSSRGNQIQFGLQLDENRAYLFIEQPGVLIRQSGPVQIDLNVTYRRGGRRLPGNGANPQVIGGGSIVIHKTKPLETNK
jgi:hypothetical protein